MNPSPQTFPPLRPLWLNPLPSHFHVNEPISKDYPSFNHNSSETLQSVELLGAGQDVQATWQHKRNPIAMSVLPSSREARAMLAGNNLKSPPSPFHTPNDRVCNLFAGFYTLKIVWFHSRESHAYFSVTVPIPLSTMDREATCWFERNMLWYFFHLHTGDGHLIHHEPTTVWHCANCRQPPQPPQGTRDWRQLPQPSQANKSLTLREQRQPPQQSQAKKRFWHWSHVHRSMQQQNVKHNTPKQNPLSVDTWQCWRTSLTAHRNNWPSGGYTYTEEAGVGTWR